MGEALRLAANHLNGPGAHSPRTVAGEEQPLTARNPAQNLVVGRVRHRDIDDLDVVRFAVFVPERRFHSPNLARGAAGTLLLRDEYVFLHRADAPESRSP